MEAKPLKINIESSMNELYENIDQMQSITNEWIKKVNDEKQRLVKERIHALIGENIDIETEAKRIFPRIKGVRSIVDQTESYYWNDGSENGKLLITFYPFNQTIDTSSDELNVKIKCGFKYL
jgi:hypothetical protein